MRCLVREQCPSNIEFIRRINGLTAIEDVKRIVFNARYLVMGLGDFYLGAPVATPVRGDAFHGHCRG
jgi:urea carboxylase